MMKTLVTIGLKCPRPLFEVHRAMKGMDGGEKIEVAADDPAFCLDIQAWCRRTGNGLLELREDPDRIIAVIEKAS